MSTFANLVPISPDASSTLDLRSNMHLINSGNRVVELTFSILMGRRCFTVGSSRASDYRLPTSDDVDLQQFNIFFDPKDQALCIKSSSLNGTRIDMPATFAIKASSPCTIRFGHGNRFKFLLIPTISSINTYHDDLALYFTSIAQRPRPCKGCPLEDTDIVVPKRAHGGGGKERHSSKRQCLR